MRCGLIGEKLGHSHSKTLHGLLADYRYDLIELAPEELGPFLKKGEFDGLNVTIPYKQAVIPYLRDLSPAARAIGSVNTIVRRPDGTLFGDNTDAYGLGVITGRAGMAFAGTKTLILGSGGTSKTARHVVEAAGGEDMLEHAFSSDIDTIKATRESISREAFNASVEAINRAKHIYVLGVRSAASLASFAAFYLNFVYDSVTLIEPAGTGEAFDQAFRINKDDVCIAISFPRYSKQTINMLRFISDRGATVISVTDSENSPIAQFATHLLLARSSMVSFVDSLVAPLSLINALIAAAASEKSGEVYSNLSSLENIWDEYQIYQTHEDE